MSVDVVAFPLPGSSVLSEYLCSHCGRLHLTTPRLGDQFAPCRLGKVSIGLVSNDPLPELFALLDSWTKRDVDAVRRALPIADMGLVAETARRWGEKAAELNAFFLRDHAEGETHA